LIRETRGCGKEEKGNTKVVERRGGGPGAISKSMPPEWSSVCEGTFADRNL